MASNVEKARDYLEQCEPTSLPEARLKKALLALCDELDRLEEADRAEWMRKHVPNHPFI
jgi:hypothetical protein